MTSNREASLDRWPPGDGEMATRVRRHDWSSTPLGPIEAWPAELRSAAASVLENAFPMALVWGTGLVTLYNDAFRTILGAKHPEALGCSFAAIWSEVWDEIGSTIERAFAGQSTFIENYRLTVQRSDAPTEAFFTFSYSPVRAADGTVLGMIDTVIETTEAVRSRAALRESEERYRAFVTASSDVVYRMGPDWSEMRQLDGRGFLADTAEPTEGWMDHYIHPLDRTRVQEAIDRAIADKSMFELEHRVRRADDTLAWTLSRAVPILDEQGNIQEWLGAAKDVSSRKRIEEALLASEEHQTFLLRLGDALRPLAGPADIQTEAARLLGEHLGSDRACYVEMDETTGGYVTARGWYRPGQGSEGREDWPMPSLLDGRTWVVCDTATDHALSDAQRGAYRDNGVGALVVAPLIKQGRLIATCLIHQRAPRNWKPEEIRLVEETAERTWAAAERSRAERALRENDAGHRRDLERRIGEATVDLKVSHDFLKAALDASTDMIQIFKAIRGAGGEIVDFNWILNNQTSELLYGEVHGESLLTKNPGVIEEGIFDAFKRVTETGVPEQAEHHYVHEQFDGWFYQSVVKLNDGVATTTKDISDWKRGQAEILRLQDEAARIRLKESEQRFRSFAENSTNVLWIVDARRRVLDYASPAFERIWGEKRERILADLGRWAEMIHPDDRERVSEALPRALAGESVQVVYRIIRPDNGEVRWIEDTGFPIRQADGEISHIGGISQDVTAQRETEERLRENRRRMWTVIQGIPQLVWRADTQGAWTWASPQWSAYTGQKETESHGFGWLNALHPDDRERAIIDWRQTDGSSYVDMETRLFHPGEQRYRWFQTRALPVRDENGAILEWLGTSTDVDDMRQLQDRQQVLVAELQHRTRNLLGVVRGMADKTAANATSLMDFLPRYRERLGALSRINGLLSKLEKGERVTFDEMIATELEARGVLGEDEGGRVTLEGPKDVRLRSATVQTFALAIHELATNAVKYGALAGGEGKLHVRWQVDRDETGRDRLHVEWTESEVSDMPHPEAAPHGGGYGRMLIEKALPYQLHAETTYEIGPHGVRCTINLPLG